MTKIVSQISPNDTPTTPNAPYRISGKGRLTCGLSGGRYWDRTSDLFGVNCWQRGRVRSPARSGGLIELCPAPWSRRRCCTSLLY